MAGSGSHGSGALYLFGACRHHLEVLLGLEDGQLSARLRTSWKSGAWSLALDESGLVLLDPVFGRDDALVVGALAFSEDVLHVALVQLVVHVLLTFLLPLSSQGCLSLLHDIRVEEVVLSCCLLGGDEASSSLLGHKPSIRLLQVSELGLFVSSNDNFSQHAFQTGMELLKELKVDSRSVLFDQLSLSGSPHAVLLACDVELQHSLPQLDEGGLLLQGHARQVIHKVSVDCRGLNLGCVSVELSIIT